MDELLQLDMSRPLHTPSHPEPPPNSQPSAPDDEPQKHSTAAWTSPFAAWDSLVGVSPTESVRHHASSGLPVSHAHRIQSKLLLCAVRLHKLHDTCRPQAADEEKREAISAEQSPPRHAGNPAAPAVHTCRSAATYSSLDVSVGVH